MKVLVVFLFVIFALVDGYPSILGKSRPEKCAKQPVENWNFEDWKVKQPSREKKTTKTEPFRPYVRWCVTNPCEMEKCRRMETEFNYMVSPRLLWSCTMKNTKEECMQRINHGVADIMTAEGEEIYKAGKKYDLIPIMSEKEDHSTIPDYDTTFSKYEDDNGHLKHYSIALVKKTNTNINKYQDMSQRKSCHSGVDNTATFKSPMCSLIHAGVVPKVGNVYESAGEFFEESCVPGVKDYKHNPNKTNPDSLCALCKGSKDDYDFCKTLSDKEPYYGFKGTLKCLRDGDGDVGFFHTHDIMENYQTLSTEFDIVCKKKKLPLKWDNVVKTDCHLTEEHSQVLMVSADKPENWISVCTRALKNASAIFSSSDGNKNAFSLFDSTPYCARRTGYNDTNDGVAPNWKKNKDLIFKDHTGSLEIIPREQRTYKKYLKTDKINTWKTCEQLEPKPRAHICVVGDDEMKKCKDMITKFQDIEDVKKISWGCVQGTCKQDCSRKVFENKADIVNLNATDMFLAGMDGNLAPFIGEKYEGKQPGTASMTIGVMRKDSSECSEDMRGMKICNAGVHKINGFLHPMGWLLANGTIKRSTSPLKSLARHFGESCVPGMNTVDLIKHPLFSRTLDWRSLFEDKEIRWYKWFKNPLWRDWEDNSTDYDTQFQSMLKVMQQGMHERHTPMIHEETEKVKQNFSWDNYDGLKDFYGKPVPMWGMIGSVWKKPHDMMEGEWNLFKMWAEKRWDQKEDWEHYTGKWTDEDWKTFKNWMDAEYTKYITGHPLLHQDTFIRCSLLCSRFYWLLKQFKNLQWDNIDIKHSREKMCDACAGQGDEKCSMDSAIEDYYDYTGALKCLKDKAGDVAFVDAYAFDAAIRNHGFKRNNFVLLCPNGKKVDINGRESLEKCNFGRVSSNALVTCNKHDGVWRWKVTKALLEAQKVLTPEKMFKDSIFGEKTESLTPISLINQTYQVWLGPMFLRAMEGLMQPPVEDEEGEKEHMDDCEGENCDDPPACIECDEGDLECIYNCWESKPRGRPSGPRMAPKVKKGPRGPRGPGMDHRGPMMDRRGPMTKQKGPRMDHQWGSMMGQMGPMMGHKGGQKGPMMGHNGGQRGPMMDHRGPMMDRRGPMTKQKGPRMDHQWGSIMGQMGPMMGHKGGQKGPMMGHNGGQEGPILDQTGPMTMDRQWGPMTDHLGPMMNDRGPMTDHRGPMLDHRGPMMGHMGPMTHIDRMKHLRLESGPMIHSPKIRGEFYTNVIFARNGTCNTISKQLNCFGERKNIRLRAGRVGKTIISVLMCPKPSVVKSGTSRFTCDTGASFFTPVLLPYECCYVPCDPGFFSPDWSQDQYWDGDNSYPGDSWGSKQWWNFNNRLNNDNWFLDNPDSNRVDKKIVKPKGDLDWLGQDWRTL